MGWDWKEVVIERYIQFLRGLTEDELKNYSRGMNAPLGDFMCKEYLSFSEFEFLKECKNQENVHSYVKDKMRLADRFRNAPETPWVYNGPKKC